MFCMWIISPNKVFIFSNLHRLATVNFFLGIVGIVQVSRILHYRYTLKDETAGELVEDAKVDVVESAKGLKAKVESAVKS